MRHAKCHYYSDVRSTVVAISIILSAALGAAAPADRPVARIDALPLAKTWSRTMDGAAPIAAAAAATHLLAGWADHFDMFLLETGEKDWSLPIPATRAACEAAFCVIADDTSVRGIDLARRAVSWQRALSAPPGSALVLRQGWVILASKTGVVRALQAADGLEVWTFDSGKALSGAPSINGNQIAIATTASSVTLLDLSNGKPLWSVTLDVQPGALRLGGGRVAVGAENGRLFILDSRTGRVRFETRTGGNVTGAPTLDDENFYAVGQDGVVRAFDRGSGAQRWYGNLATRASDGPSVDGDLVFVPLRTGAVDVRLNNGKAVVVLPAPGAATSRLPMPPIVTGGGSTLSILTISYDLGDAGKWTLVRHSSGARLAPTARPARIPGLALKLTEPGR